MGGDNALTLLDGTVLVILLIGLTRGIFIGMVRESFSMAGLGAAVLAARYGTPIAAEVLLDPVWPPGLRAPRSVSERSSQ